MSISKVRILAVLQPVIAVLSGAFVAWLFVHVHVLGIFHVSQSQAATDIASGVVFVITAALSWLSQHEHLVPITTAIKLGAAPPKLVLPTVERVVRFLTPYVSVVAGALTAWLFVHVHFLGIFHLAQNSVAAAVASGIVFTVTSVLTWLAHQYHILPTFFPPPVLTHPQAGRVGSRVDPR